MVTGTDSIQIAGMDGWVSRLRRTSALVIFFVIVSQNTIRVVSFWNGVPCSHLDDALVVTQICVS